MTRQVAAEGTLKEQNVTLLNKVRMRQSELGIHIADLFVVARGLHNAFFSAPMLDEEVTLSVEWEPIESRDEDAELARAVLKAEKLSVPLPQIWSELGYSDVQITQWTAAAEAKEQRRRGAGRAAGSDAGSGRSSR